MPVASTTRGKTIGYRLLRLGTVPRRRRPKLEAERIRVLDEGIPVTVTLRRYRARGRRIRWRRQRLSGAIVLTDRRIVAFAWWGRLFDLPLDTLPMTGVDASLDRRGRLSVNIDVSSLGTGRSGRIACAFRTERAAALLAALVGNRADDEKLSL